MPKEIKGSTEHSGNNICIDVGGPKVKADEQKEQVIQQKRDNRNNALFNK